MLAFIAVCVLVPYLLGSLSFSIIVSKGLYHQDIRKFGSGNAGMTNILRTYGKKAAGGFILAILETVLKFYKKFSSLDVFVFVCALAIVRPFA